MTLRLIIMNFLQFAIWGAYLTCMGSYLHTHGLAANIGMFYAVQGIISIFMPALMGIVADKWIPAQKTMSLCHFISGAAMIGAGIYGIQAGDAVQVAPLFSLYTLGVAFYMPTLALSNSVAYNALDKAGMDTVKHFPPIRIFGTIGFIVTMISVDLLGFQNTAWQFVVSGAIGIVLAAYALSLPNCPINKSIKASGIVEALGLQAFALFKQKKMAIFFIFSMLLGVSLQITNGFANPFLQAFQELPEFANAYFAEHANLLISLSQMSETLCILLIPFFLKRFGIKKVMLIAMFAWVLRFAFFGLGNPSGGLWLFVLSCIESIKSGFTLGVVPSGGLWLFVLSCIVYGVAFDFFNISGSLFVDKETSLDIRSSAQGLFMLMTNGIGATIGTLGAQAIVNHFVLSQTDAAAQMAGWRTSWFIFAAYALVVAVLFAIVFKYKHVKEEA